MITKWIHKHAPTGPCRTVCGLSCDTVDIAWPANGREVTCPVCEREERS